MAKIRIYNACAKSTLLYGMINKSEMPIFYRNYIKSSLVFGLSIKYYAQSAFDSKALMLAKEIVYRLRKQYESIYRTV